MFFMGFVLYFFRVPKRQSVGAPNDVTAVADGKIVVVDKVFEPEYLNSECIQVSIYMDFFNVHVNFWPISGEVTYYKYHPGKYMLAFLPKASELNEHSSMAIRNQHGDVFFKQLAGTFARRIICYAVPGNKENKGDQCGIIRFGSRIDMYLPLDADIKVKIGDYVRACETVIAELK
jgi:phosphatidylserine decarboxylase